MGSAYGGSHHRHVAGAGHLPAVSAAGDRRVCPSWDSVAGGGSVTTPALPSTVIMSPLWMRLVATPVPRTAGTPYSRATIELWLSGPPTSVTTADASASTALSGDGSRLVSGDGVATLRIWSVCDLGHG